MANLQQQAAQPYGQRDQEFDDEIDLHELLGTLIDGKWLIAAVAALVLLAGIAYLFITPPIYKADALIQVEDTDSGLSSAFGDMGALLGQQGAAVAGEIEILRSRMIVGQAVENLRLDITAEPAYFPLLGQAIARRYSGTDIAPPKLGMSSLAWGGEVIEVGSFDVPEAFLGETFRLIAGENDRYQLLGPEDEAVLDGRVGESFSAQLPSGELRLFVTDLQARPGTSFKITRRATLTTIADLQSELSISERGKQSNMIGLSLEGSNRSRTAGIVNEIANLYLRQNVERKSAEAAQTLEFLDKQLPIIKQELEAAEVAFNSYRNQKGTVDLDKEAGAILEQMVKAEQQKTLLRQKREELTRRFTPAHPIIVAVDAQIADLDEVLGRLEQHVKGMPQTQQEILRLARDAKVNTELYTSLLNNYQQLQVAKAGTIGNVRIVDHALLPVKPVKPKPALILALSLVLGLFLGVLVVFMRNMLQSGVQDPDLLESHLGLPVYATVPHSRAQAKLIRQMRKGGSQNLVLATLKPEELAIESLRNLRTALHFAALGSKNNILMLSGPAPGIGKSFISVNLASVIAATGARVLLIDADMRRGHLHQYLGQPREPGLSDLITGTADAEQFIRKTSTPGLDLLSTGSIPPNPSELLLHERFATLLDALSKQYDHVIIDSPPVLAVTDAAIIGRLSGMSLMVVKAGAHPLREVEQATKRLKQAGVNLRGLLFNDVKKTNSRHGSRYSYQYAYKSD